VLQGGMLRTTLPANDLARARAFYAEKLGLKVVQETPDGGLVFEVGGDHAAKPGWSSRATFLVFPTTNPNRGGHTQMGFHVDDVEREVADLKRRGVVFEEYDLPGLKTLDSIASIADGKGRAAWFKDSEGNIIGLVSLPF